MSIIFTWNFYLELVTLGIIHAVRVLLHAEYLLLMRNLHGGGLRT